MRRGLAGGVADRAVDIGDDTVRPTTEVAVGCFRPAPRNAAKSRRLAAVVGTLPSLAHFLESIRLGPRPYERPGRARNAVGPAADGEDFWHSPNLRNHLGDPSFSVDEDTLAVAERFRVVERL
jgi:hypothetical protein